MRHRYDAGVGGKLAQQLEYLFSGYAVKITGRFVRKKYIRGFHNGSDDRDALFLSSGQFVAPPALAARHAYALESALYKSVLIAVLSAEVERHGGIFACGQRCDEIEILKYESGLFAAVCDHIGLRKRTHRLSVHIYFAFVVAVQTRHKIEQSGFAASGSA